VLGREVVEGEQRVAILDQALDRLDVFDARICHLAMEGERDPVRLHDRALVGLIPATIWREAS
jgi:hypothetical protein